MEEPNRSENREGSVRIFIVRDDKVLLVHEVGKHPGNPVSDLYEDYNVTERRIKKYGKPPGWGLPGGKVRHGVQAMAGQIFKFFGMFQVDFDQSEIRDLLTTTPTWTGNAAVDLKLFLSVIKEAIEETGYIIKPDKLLMSWDKNASYKIDVISARIIGGNLRKRSGDGDIDDCGWFDLYQLPEDTYESHQEIIYKSVDRIKELGVIA